jgi:hypothetical protein
MTTTCATNAPSPATMSAPKIGVHLDRSSSAVNRPSTPISSSHALAYSDAPVGGLAGITIGSSR